MSVSPTSSAYLTVDTVRVGYALGRPVHEIVHDLSFTLQGGDIGCLLGPSGCGKTTVLRAVAGCEALSGGHITLGGKVLRSAGFTAPPEIRNVGVVFQDYALFPHLSIEDNIAFGLRKLSPMERGARVGRLLSLVGLTTQRSKFPHELSGGQQQRVALARALAPRPAL